MENPPPGLGLFSRLPYELREQIWLEFLPSPEQEMRTMRHTASCTKSCRYTKRCPGLYIEGPPPQPITDLRVLCTSKLLYTEISEAIYSNLCVRFDLAFECLGDNQAGPRCIAYLTYNRKRKAGKGTEATLVKWDVRDCIGTENHWFNGFPFGKVGAVEINIPAPKMSHDVYWLLRNVIRTAELLIDSPSIPALTIRLCAPEERKDDWRKDDWCAEKDDWCAEKWFTRDLFKRLDSPGDHSYDVLTRPFYLLRNIGFIRIEPHSQELRETMDWGKIEWATRKTSKRPQIDDDAEHDLWCAAFEDYRWMRREARYRGLKDEYEGSFIHIEFATKGFGYIFSKKFKSWTKTYEPNSSGSEDLKRTVSPVDACRIDLESVTPLFLEEGKRDLLEIDKAEQYGGFLP